MALCPSSAVTTLYPSLCSVIRTIFNVIGLSSTTRIVCVFMSAFLRSLIWTDGTGIAKGLLYLSAFMALTGDPARYISITSGRVRVSIGLGT